MDLPFFSSKVFIFIIPLFIFSTLRKGHAKDFEKYSRCLETKFECGKDFVRMSYPFWGNKRPSYCGLEGFELTCNSEKDYPTISIDTFQFRVLNISQSDHEIWITSTDLEDDTSLCPLVVGSTFLNSTRFGSNPKSEVIYIYHDCPDGLGVNFPSSLIWDEFKCFKKGVPSKGYYVADSFSEAQSQAFEQCKIREVAPVLRKAFEEHRNNESMSLVELLKQGFTLDYLIDEVACSACVNSSGLCGSSDADAKRFQGLCRDGAYPVSCPRKHRNLGLKTGLKISIASSVVGASGLGGCIILLLVILFICRHRMRAKYGSSMFSQESSSYPKDVEAFIKQYGSSIPKTFRYSTLKKITNSFKDELGKGGFGNVYKGHLADGRVVAVKVLKETKGDGEEFLNEVASIGRTSHVNVVTLLGFCYEGKRRALIYEFMPNGFLEKFIYGTSPSLEGQHLGWEKLYSIAVGIARGLEYLHRGCNTRILHFDIKPHNILLDDHFRPKISDFGLAKLYATDDSIISSLLHARGTVGYIAPEVASRNFGQVSHKSDVYSYGMMILEMVGGRKNVNAGADHTSEIYYPRWLYKRIQFDDVLNLANGISAEENEIVRKMVIVGLWCIQIYPTQRPSISKVIEMLEGKRSALEIPPRPYLCSIPTSSSNIPKKMDFSSSSGTEPTSSI